ncbi:hypothetical protein NC651_024813 [Populus alba x Populus x berolinensis]|nr:hypothetical protein NC651_024813 [Populus alba x Populus x berolinensis]
MGALIKVVIDEYYTLTEDKDLAIGLVSMKWCVVFFMFHRSCTYILYREAICEMIRESHCCAVLTRCICPE